MDYFVGGSYIDRFERRDGEWKIVECVGMTDWTRTESPGSQDFVDLDQRTVGKRAPDDFIYTGKKFAATDARTCPNVGWLL